MYSILALSGASMTGENRMTRGGGITPDQVLVGFGQTLAMSLCELHCRQRRLIVVYREESGSTIHATL